jgi:hypothetical protein
MRKLLPVGLLLISGCVAGPLTRKPGGNVLLPKASGPLELILKDVACRAVKQDSARRTGVPARDPACLSVGPETAPDRPPHD